jgi:cell division protein FtsA
MAAPRVVAALDIGSSKVCCFVARPDGHGGARVIGIGHQVSRGLRAGAVVDMEAAEESVRAAVDAAERMAGETVKSVYVNLSGGRPASQIMPVEMAINGRQIGDAEIRRLLAQAKARCEGADAKALHAIPTGYSIDGASRIADPRGMYGDRLGVSLHVVTAASGPMRNLRTVTERCHLQIEDFCVSPYASALSALVADEMDLGVTLVDMGGGSTGIAVFYDGAMVHAEVVPIGGGHVTSDIARGLSTPTGHAERMKTLYGSAIPSPSDEREMISVPQVGETGSDSVQQIPRSMLVGIIQPRVEETLELVRERLEHSGFGRVAGRRLVLTGGACQLTGVRELAARVLDKQVRVGRPLRMHGLAEATEGPAFATCAGLVAYAIRRPREARADAEPELASAGGRFAGLARWLKENF